MIDALASLFKRDEPSELRRAWPHLALVALVHLAVAWPGAAERGVIAEEVQPYLRRYPAVLDLQMEQGSREHADEHLAFLPPNDDPAVRAAADAGGETSSRWVGTNQWPEVGYQGRTRNYPVFVRGHQTSIGTMWGVAGAPLLGGGIGGVRRANVLLGLVLLGLTWALARRLGLSRALATFAAIGCALSPGLFWVGRTGYGYEIASRVLMMAALFAIASTGRLSTKHAVLGGLAFAGAILSRATIATTLVPPLLLMALHPRRFAGWPRLATLLGVGGGVPVAFVALALATLPFAAGTEPAATLSLDALAGRTLVTPAMAAVQLAWVADARMILTPLIEGGVTVSMGWVRPLLGGVVLVIALARWWFGRAREGERLFVAGLLGNSLIGAWLYGSPLQFQLGMALEPLFVLAVAHQLHDLGERRALHAVLACVALLGVRAVTLRSVIWSERSTDNPMLSGVAQRSLVTALRERGVRGDDLVTTTYDHVGVLESLTDERLRPVHAWRLLKAANVPPDVVEAHWRLILDDAPRCHVLLTRAPSLVAGRFADQDAVGRALEKVLTERGVAVTERLPITGDGGAVVFELLTLAPCGR
ncbi:MAG: hypothetical protein U0271_27635 [Polyangiaceae bacterium]